MKSLSLLILLAGLSQPASGVTIAYRNNTFDTGNSMVFSVEGATELGDLVTLDPFGNSLLTQVTVQFFNLGTTGTFDAVIRIVDASLMEIGLVTLTGISAPEATSVDVTFSFPSLLIPGTIGIAISLANVTGGADLGLNLFDSPDIGSSDNLMALANFGSGLAIASFDPGNLYLIIETQQLSEVPEPSTLGLLGAGMAALAAASLRRPLGTRGRRCASAHVVRRSSTSATATGGSSTCW